MPDYTKGTIYKIVCNNTGLIYVGSTCQPLSKRLGGHVKAYKRSKYVSSSQIIANGNYSIILIEEYPCENKQQLLRREREYIDSLECVNKYRPIVSIEERKEYEKQYRNTNKEYNKEYYNTNKDKIKEQTKEYQKLNKEQIALKKKEYNNNNKDKNKEYRELNKEYYKLKNKEKAKCSICNSELLKRGLTRHKRQMHKVDFTLIE